MKMLIDHPGFDHHASIPWPAADPLGQLDWEMGVRTVNHWLEYHIGPHLTHWAWADSGHSYQLGVSFRWDRDRLLFVLHWT